MVEKSQPFVKKTSTKKGNAKTSNVLKTSKKLVDAAASKKSVKTTPEKAIKTGSSKGSKGRSEVSKRNEKSSKKTRDFTLTLTIPPLILIANTYLKANIRPKTLVGKVKEELPQTLIDVTSEISLNDLKDDDSSKCVHYLDSHKKRVKYWIVMLDQNAIPLPDSTKFPCWHCRSEFKYAPLGCPLKRVSYVGKTECKKSKTMTRYRLETEGIFCGFPCVKAYLLEQTSIRYAESWNLLSWMYCQYMNTLETTGKIVEKNDKRVMDPAKSTLSDISIEIPIAPSWKLIDTFGGHLSIDRYRASFGRLEYKESINFRRLPINVSTHSISQYIEERVS